METPPPVEPPTPVNSEPRSRTPIVLGVAIGGAALTLGGNVRAAIGDAAKDVHKCNNGTYAASSTSVVATTC